MGIKTKDLLVQNAAAEIKIQISSAQIQNLLSIKPNLSLENLLISKTVLHETRESWSTIFDRGLEAKAHLLKNKEHVCSEDINHIIFQGFTHDLREFLEQLQQSKATFPLKALYIQPVTSGDLWEALQQPYLSRFTLSYTPLSSTPL